MWVFFWLKCAKLSTFYILQIFETIDAVVLTFLMVLSFAMEIVLLPIKIELIAKLYSYILEAILITNNSLGPFGSPFLATF